MTMTSPRRRGLIGAALVLAIVAALALTVDYGFYFSASGLTISSSVLPWDTSWSYLAAFAVAAVNSLAAGLIAILLSTLIGVGIGVLGTLANPTAQLICRLYVGAFRTVPVLFVILLVYFIGITLPAPAQAPDLFGLVFLSNRGLVLPEFHLAAPLMLALAGLLSLLALAAPFLRVKLPLVWRLIAGLVALVLAAWLMLDATPPERGKFGFRSGFEIPLEFLALTMALSFYYASEIAEITRGAILSINKGIIEASHALGLHSFDRFRKITAPLALRFGLPGVLNSYLVVMKATSLGVAIGYTELFSVTRLSLSSSGRIIECFTLMGLYFLVICGSLSLIVNRINARLRTEGR